MTFSMICSAALAAVTPVFVNHNSVKGSVKVMTNQVAWSEKVERRVADGRYALFVIPVSAEYPDFELKATTNNYVKAAGEWEAFCPFYASTTFNGNTSWKADAFRLYVCYSKLNSDGDSRRWRRILNTVDDGLVGMELPATSVAVLVDPALLGRGQGSGWLSDGNADLVWNYVRISATGPEREVQSDEESPWLWRQVMPVKWYHDLPGWADQECYPH